MIQRSADFTCCHADAKRKENVRLGTERAIVALALAALTRPAHVRQAPSRGVHKRLQEFSLLQIHEILHGVHVDSEDEVQSGLPIIE